MPILRQNIHQETQPPNLLQLNLQKRRPPRTQKKLGLPKLPQKQNTHQQHKNRHTNNRTTQTPG